MKIIAKPTGAFMLILAYGETLMPHRPSVLTCDDFVQSKIAAGMVKVIESDLPEEATDLEYEKFWEESNKDEALSVQSFVSKFKPAAEPEAQPVKEEAPKKAAK